MSGLWTGPDGRPLTQQERDELQAARWRDLDDEPLPPPLTEADRVAGIWEGYRVGALSAEQRDGLLAMPVPSVADYDLDQVLF